MNSQHPEQHPPAEQVKKPWYNQGWVWLIIAVVGIGVLFFGFSGLTDQMTEINQSIQDNTSAIQEQSFILSDIKQEIQQLIVLIKDSVNELMRSFA
ncbi:methyl-accepting chemotaxis protein [Ammoniphilus resinae]|uniref:Cell division protein FtsL n=1 Tax=Ammoniphilus resinae TaxID=861532 RepID=A0ABS4GW49_9BACL|nr:methyl-accepting chemotaxis protein [Ammoniphilus resinae]MBP1934501.1 cell division protein FtsL [Ammoniphilus resinae]